MQKKCLVESTLKEHMQSWLMQLKLCLNLCLLMWLKPNLNLVSNFRPKRWWILFLRSEIDRLTLSKVYLNFLKDFALLNGKSSCFCHSKVQLRESLYFFVTTLQEFDSLKIILLKKEQKQKINTRVKHNTVFHNFLGKWNITQGKAHLAYFDESFNWFMILDLHDMDDTIQRVCFQYKLFSFQFTAGD